MNPRVRKLIGLVGILVFLTAYVFAAVTIGERLSGHWAVQLAYYAVVGTAWGVPILPLISWMNSGRWR